MCPETHVFRRCVLVHAVPLLLACGGDQGIVPVEPSVVVSPDGALLVGAGSTVALHADVVGGAPVAWVSSDMVVATVDATGLVTAVATGTATVSVRSGTAHASALVEVWAPAAVTRYEPGASYFGRARYVEYVPGDLPLVISVPHGGGLAPQEIPDRASGTLVTDANTIETAQAVRDAFIQRTGRAPHLIISHLKRTKLDPNREVVEAAQGNPYAENAWDEFQSFIDVAEGLVVEGFGSGLCLDLHGHGHEIPPRLAWTTRSWMREATPQRVAYARWRREARCRSVASSGEARASGPCWPRRASLPCRARRPRRPGRPHTSPVATTPNGTGPPTRVRSAASSWSSIVRASATPMRTAVPSGPSWPRRWMPTWWPTGASSPGRRHEPGGRARPRGRLWKRLAPRACRAPGHGIVTVAVSMDVESYRATVASARDEPLVLPSFGIHPWNAPEWAHRLHWLDAFVDEAPMLGEVGLDRRFVKDAGAYGAQQEVFAFFLDAAKRTGKLLNVHTSGAEAIIAEKLGEAGAPLAVVHWYNGPMRPLAALTEMGVYFSVGVEVLRSERIRKVAGRVPLDRLLSETDNPGGWAWLEGSPGMPALLERVVDRLAEVRGLSRPEMEAVLEANARRLLRQGGVGWPDLEPHVT